MCVYAYNPVDIYVITHTLLHAASSLSKQTTIVAIIVTVYLFLYFDLFLLHRFICAKKNCDVLERIK